MQLNILKLVHRVLEVCFPCLSTVVKEEIVKQTASKVSKRPKETNVLLTKLLYIYIRNSTSIF